MQNPEAVGKNQIALIKQRYTLLFCLAVEPAARYIVQRGKAVSSIRKNICREYLSSCV
jgi:hypothetical protein